MEPYTLSMFAWILGHTVQHPEVRYPSKAACVADKDNKLRSFNRSLPTNNYRINATCVPTNYERTYQELAGKEGWGCFKAGKCFADQPDFTVRVEGAPNTVIIYREHGYRRK